MSVMAQKQVYVQDSRIHYKYTMMQTLLYDTLMNQEVMKS